MTPTPRVECHSLISNDQKHFLFVNSPAHRGKYIGTKIQAVGSLRVDSCNTQDDLPCSNTWGSIDYFVESRNVQVDESAPLLLRKENPLEGYFFQESLAKAAIIKKYGEAAYNKNSFKGETFSMALKTDGDIAALPQESLSGYMNVKKLALINANQKVPSNASLSWSYTLGSLELTGEVSLYCYGWQ